MTKRIERPTRTWGSFAPRRKAFDGALGDGEEKGGLGWLQKAHRLGFLLISHRYPRLRL